MRGNKLLMALCSFLLVLAVVAGGGCNGSSSSKSGVSALDLIETDSSGVPKLFTLPGSSTSDIALMDKDGEVDVEAPMSVISAVGYPPKPAGVKALADGDDTKTTDIDRYLAKGLRKGIKYTFEVTLNGMTPLNFAPMIKLSRIVKEAPIGPNAPTPIKKTDSGKQGELENLNAEPEVYYEPLSYHASNIPAVDTAIIAGTFTAPEDGDYLIEVSDAYDSRALPALDPKSNDENGYKGEAAEYQVSPHLYIFRFYEERGKTPEMYGSPIEVYGDNGYVLTPSDLVELRRAIMSPSTQVGMISDKNGEKNINGYHWDLLGEPDDFAQLADPPSMLGAATSAALVDAGLTNANGPTPNVPSFPQIKDDNAGNAAMRAYNAVLGSIQGTSVYNGRSISPKAVSSKGTRLDSIIKGIPFKSEFFENGVGIDAPTGMFAQQQIIDNVDFGESKIQSPVTTSTAQFISTKEDYEKTLSVNTDVSLNISSMSIKNDNSVKNSVKYSNLTTTLWLHFDITDQLYQEIPLSKFVLTPVAKSDIAKGMSASDFRKRYGDYIVNGFCHTAHYDAFITITTNSVEKLQQVKNNLKIDVKKVVSGNTEVDTQTKEALKNTNIQITVNTIGKPRSGWVPDFTFIGAGDSDSGLKPLFENMVNFAKPALEGRDFEYGIKYMSMRRVSSLPGCDFLPEEIDMEPDLFVKTRQMSRARLELIAQYNAVKDIPDNNIVSGRKREWTEKFMQLYDETSTRLNEICSSVAKVEEQTRKLNDLADEFSAISQRWSFYRSLMSEKDREKKEFGTLHGSYDNAKSWSWGYENFPWSSLVNNSVYQGYNTWCYSADEGASAFSSWYWEIDHGPSGDSQIAYMYIWSRSNNDDITRRNDFTIGNKSLHVYFDGGFWREIHWKLNYRRANIDNKNDWPFVGL